MRALTVTHTIMLARFNNRSFVVSIMLIECEPATESLLDIHMFNWTIMYTYALVRLSCMFYVNRDMCGLDYILGMVLASQFIGGDILFADSKQLITTILCAPNGTRCVGSSPRMQIWNNKHLSYCYTIWHYVWVDFGCIQNPYTIVRMWAFLMRQTMKINSFLPKDIEAKIICISMHFWHLKQWL